MAKNVRGKRVNLVIPACKFWQIVSQLSRMQTISFYFAIHFSQIVTNKYLTLTPFQIIFGFLPKEYGKM